MYIQFNASLVQNVDYKFYAGLQVFGENDHSLV